MYNLNIKLPDDEAQALLDSLNAHFANDTEPPVVTPIKPLPDPVPTGSPPRGVIKVSFKSIWGKRQPTGPGRFAFTYRRWRSNDYKFTTGGGICIPGLIKPGQRVTIATPDATSGGQSVAEKSISLAPGDYKNTLAHGIGNPYNADYSNETDVVMAVYFNIRIANFSDWYQPRGWPTAACMLKFTQR